jgi:hypothetical protein
VDEMEDTMLSGLRARDRETFLQMVKSAVRGLGAGFPHD